MPDYERLFKTVGIRLIQNLDKAAFGMQIRNQNIITNTNIGSSAYDAGLEKGDKLIKINNIALNDSNINEILQNDYKVGDVLSVVYERFGKTRETQMTLKGDISYLISSEELLSEEVKSNRDAWLGAK